MTEIDVPAPTVWLTRQEVADRFRLSTVTLAQWGCRSEGPKFSKFGKEVRYRLADVEAWENAQPSGGAQ